jgi:hypothetical protein
MGLALYSEKGWVANLVSNYALSLFEYNVKKTGVNVSALVNFLDEGVTEDINQVLQELDAVISVISDKDTKGVAVRLREGLTKIKDKEVAIISQ